MSLPIARVALRQSRLAFRQQAFRNASTTSEAANAASSTASKAKDQAQVATSKASEGLSRVTSSAGPAISKASSAVGNTVSRIGGRTGRLISLVQSMIPTTVYYSRVGLELGRLVFQGQKMSPPSMQAVQGYFERFYHTLRHPGSLMNQASNATSGAIDTAAQNPQSYLQRLRNLDGATLASGGVVVAEIIGFFTVGEMLGRLKVIGYRSGKSAPDAQVHH